MKIDIVTLFPEMFEFPLGISMMKKAKDIKAVEIDVHNLRRWTSDKHKTVDDRPFGGGLGMVIKVDIVDKAIKELSKASKTKYHTILLSPQGKIFNQQKAQKLSKKKHLIIISGHYEGFDQRIVDNLVDEEISIGDYVLTGGEIPAMAITDAIVRLLPGVLDPEATHHESFSLLITHGSQPTSLLDYPTYTRPANYKGWKVPEVLVNGNHNEIEKWRKKEAIKTTQNKRPDLLS